MLRVFVVNAAHSTLITSMLQFVPRKPSLNCGKCGSHKIVLQNGAAKCRGCADEWRREKYATSREHRIYGVRKYVRRKYGVTYEQLELLFIKQRSCCAICERSWRDCGRPKLARHETSFLQYLNVDHDHKTGKFVVFFVLDATLRLANSMMTHPELTPR